MRYRKPSAVIALVLAAVCWTTVRAQETSEPAAAPTYEKRVLFEPLVAPSMAPREDEPTIFLPTLFRPPVPFLKLDDRYEAFVDNVEIQAELQEMEKLFLNPYSNLSSELTGGIKTEIGAYGEVVRYYDFAGGRFEFSSAAGPYGRPGTWATGYDYESWLDNSNRGAGDR